LPCRRALVPGMVKTHGLTHKPMLILEVHGLQEGRLVHGAVDQRHGRKESPHHGRCRRGGRTLLAREVSRRSAAREAALPWDARLDQEAHDGAPRQHRHPCRLLPPSRTDGRGLLAPAQARFPHDRLCLVCLAPCGFWTHLRPPRRGQDGPPVGRRGGHARLTVPSQVRAARDRGPRGLGRTPALGPMRGHADRCSTRVERGRAPGGGLAAAPSRPPACLVSAGRRRGGGPGPPARCHGPDGRGDPRGCLRWGGRLRPSRRGAHGLAWTPSKRRSATARRPSASSPGTRRPPLGPGPRRGGSCRGRPGWARHQGQPRCGWPQASPSWRPAHGRGPTVRSPARGSRPHPRGR
jgi:hypothetical protein